MIAVRSFPVVRLDDDSCCLFCFPAVFLAVAVCCWFAAGLCSCGKRAVCVWSVSLPVCRKGGARRAVQCRGGGRRGTKTDTTKTAARNKTTTRGAQYQTGLPLFYFSVVFLLCVRVCWRQLQETETETATDPRSKTQASA